MAKQPFYHRMTVLFTATRPIEEQELIDVLDNCLVTSKELQVVPGFIDFEEYEEPLPGDPSDL